MVGTLKDAPEIVRTAAILMLGTGQRPNAAISMQFDDFDGDWVWVWDEKGKDKFEIYCPPMLADYMSGIQKRGRHLIAKNLSEPLGYNAVEHRFRRWRDTLGDKAKPYSLHGLRKLAIIELAEAGCGDAQIQAVTGQSAEMVAQYRAKANRKKLSKSAQERRK